jgi:ABC-type uncharacterized transport system ATPase subunit
VETDPLLAETYRDLALGVNSPAWGQILWFGSPKPQANDIWGTAAFQRRLGYIPNKGRLISGLTLIENLALGYEYCLGFDHDRAFKDSQKWLDKLELTKETYTLAENLNPTLYPMALLALNLAKNPDLFLLERPRLKFGGSFPLALEVLKTEHKARNLAIIIFERDESLFKREKPPSSDLIIVRA